MLENNLLHETGPKWEGPGRKNPSIKSEPKSYEKSKSLRVRINPRLVPSLKPVLDVLTIRNLLLIDNRTDTSGEGSRPELNSRHARTRGHLFVTN